MSGGHPTVPASIFAPAAGAGAEKDATKSRKRSFRYIPFPTSTSGSQVVTAGT